MLDIKAYQLRTDFKITPSILTALDALPESTWLSHVNQACYSGKWQVHPLRGLAKYSRLSPILQAFSLEESVLANDFVDYSTLMAFPDLTTFIAQLSCPVLSVRLMRCKASVFAGSELGYTLSFLPSTTDTAEIEGY